MIKGENIAALIALFFISSLGVCAKDPGKKAYIFDVGGEESKVEKGTVLLTENMLYNDQAGYGWIIKPSYSFDRINLSRSRSAFTIDGVTGKKFSFKADLSQGKWWITLWIEAGLEDSTTTQIYLNDKLQELNWQSFTPPDEPRQHIQKTYRIFSGSFDLRDKYFDLTVGSLLDSVRLLGFTLIPHPESLTDEEQKLLNELKDAGRYNSNYDLNELLKSISGMLNNKPDNLFASFYKQQIELMIQAENLYNMRGWEWATVKTGLGLFDRFPQIIMILDAIVNMKESPFYERALWIKSKVLYWLDRQRGFEHEKAVSSKGLKELYNLYPDDKILAIYNGKKIDFADKCDSLKVAVNAPLWSKLQYESLCRLRDEVGWWVNVRQANNGELGGKLGDDMEILRGWHPAILSGDTNALKGWERLADCVWESPLVYKGYSLEADDVEHSSEFISDTTPELVFFTDKEKYLDRIRYSTEYFQNLWTGLADNGKRYFKSAWFSSTEIDTTPPKNRDVEMNTRAAKAVRYYAWKTRDSVAIDFLHQWSLAWVDAAKSADKHKPIGIFPASISYPSGDLNGNEETWFDANMYWGYYNWRHSAGSKMYDQLLFTYLLIHDTELLLPLKLTLQLINKYEDKNISFDSISIGSEEWAVSILKRKKEFWNTVEQYRFMTSDTTYDNLLFKYGSLYSKYRLTCEIEYIEEALTNYLNSIRYNSPLRTTEALHTDRVYYPGGDNLKAMLSGDGTNEGTSPYYAVSWENTSEYFTALVKETGKRKLNVEVFSHSEKNQEIIIRIWQLDKGNYLLIIKDEDEKIESSEITINKQGDRIRLNIPSQKLINITIKKLNE